MDQGEPPAGDGAGQDEDVAAVAKQLRRRPGLLVAVLAIAVAAAIIGVALVPAPFQMLPAAAAVPVMGWLVVRWQGRRARPAAPGPRRARGRGR